MGAVLKTCFLVFLFCVIGYVAGVRVHPEALSATVPAAAAPKGVELTFKDGQRFVGRIVKETPDGIMFNMDGAEMSFTNDEIVSRHEVSLPSVSKSKKQPASFVTYDPSLSIWKRMIHEVPDKKPAFQASSLWGTKPRAAEAPASMPGTMSGDKAADPNSLMGIYQKSMSKESLDQWKSQATEAMSGAGRNPFVEAAREAQAKAAASNTERSEAKLKELEEQGY